MNLCVCVFWIRIEEAEGVGVPKDSEHLNMNRDCSDSKLMLGMWASALLLGPTGETHHHIKQLHS